MQTEALLFKAAHKLDYRVKYEDVKGEEGGVRDACVSLNASTNHATINTMTCSNCNDLRDWTKTDWLIFVLTLISSLVMATSISLVAYDFQRFSWLLYIILLATVVLTMSSAFYIIGGAFTDTERTPHKVLGAFSAISLPLTVTFFAGEMMHIMRPLLGNKAQQVVTQVVEECRMSDEENEDVDEV